MSKILLCGDGMVGKTSLSKQFAGLGVSGRYLMTIGADMLIQNKKYTLNGEEYTVRFFMWDLAGQQRFSIVRPRYYQGGHAAFLVYDITNRSSFDNIYKWIEEIKTHNSAFPIPLILVANKIDLKSKVNDSISTSEGLEFADKLSKLYDLDKENRISYIETSALTGENVNEAFEHIGKQFIRLALKQQALANANEY